VTLSGGNDSFNRRMFISVGAVTVFCLCSDEWCNHLWIEEMLSRVQQNKRELVSIRITTLGEQVLIRLQTTN
jgi:hypothetical protein